jgi:hypothetical protein
LRAKGPAAGRSPRALVVADVVVGIAANAALHEGRHLAGAAPASSPRRLASFSPPPARRAALDSRSFRAFLVLRGGQGEAAAAASDPAEATTDGAEGDGVAAARPQEAATA